VSKGRAGENEKYNLLMVSATLPEIPARIILVNRDY
jgi:hypothetical protein